MRPTRHAGLPPPPEVIMRGEPFRLPPPAPPLLAQRSTQPQFAEQRQRHADPPTGLPPAPVTLMVGEAFRFGHLCPNSWRRLMPDMVTVHAGMITHIITSSITTNTTTSIILIRLRAWMDTSMVDTGPTS